MPRDGSNIYHTPPGTDGIPNTTVASTPYNGYLADIAQDLNLPRPIVAGGTGANSAAAAMTNLGGELAGQVVTNYDSFAFVSGSFYSAAGATNAPSANAHRGFAYVTDSNNITVEARDNTTGTKLYRQKTAGTWGAWTGDLTVNPAYVLKAGDTMTGDLKLSVAAPDVILNKASGVAGTQCNVWGQTNNVPRWVMQLGNEISEGGANAGSNFTLQRYSDAGAYIDNVAAFNRATGAGTFSGSANFGGAITAGGAVISLGVPSYQFGAGGAVYLTYNPASGGTFTLNGGTNFVVNPSLYCMDAITSRKTATTGQYYFGASGAVSLYFDGGKFNFVGGEVEATGEFYVAGAYRCRSGYSGSYGVNNFNIMWTGSAAQFWINNTNTGNLTITSDYRTKKDVAELPSMWGTVKALRPIKYTQAQFSPPSHTMAEPFFRADNIERWGFVAHELQQTLVPSAASGVKDAPNEIQAPNPFTIIAALTKALQEAMTRIEALEAANGP